MRKKNDDFLRENQDNDDVNAIHLIAILAAYGGCVIRLTSLTFRNQYEWEWW